MRDLISVIVPVYNVEKYLDKCVDSIVHQTYENLEILLVDDGSSDASGRMCDDWSRKDFRIRVIHKENGGQAQARNRGLEICTGTYIVFVDADDYVDRNFVAYLHRLAKQYEAEIAVCGLRLVTPEERKLNRLTADGSIRIMDQHDALKELCQDRWLTCSPCAKLFKRSIIGDICFPEGHIYEDMATVYRWIMNASRVVLGQELLYGYVERMGSTVKSAFHIRRMDAAVFAEQMCHAIRERFPDLYTDTQKRLFIEYASVLRALSLSPMKNDLIQDCAAKLYAGIRQTRADAWRAKLTPTQRYYVVCSYFGRKALQYGFRLQSFVYRQVKYRKRCKGAFRYRERENEKSHIYFI